MEARMKRRDVLGLGVAGVLCGGAAAAASAQTRPEPPVLENLPIGEIVPYEATVQGVTVHWVRREPHTHELALVEGSTDPFSLKLIVEETVSYFDAAQQLVLQCTIRSIGPAFASRGLNAEVARI